MWFFFFLIVIRQSYRLVAYLTVNAGVIDLKTFGNKELKDYNDFKQLVDKINDI